VPASASSTTSSAPAAAIASTARFTSSVPARVSGAGGEPGERTDAVLAERLVNHQHRDVAAQRLAVLVRLADDGAHAGAAGEGLRRVSARGRDGSRRARKQSEGQLLMK